MRTGPAPLGILLATSEDLSASAVGTNGQLSIARSVERVTIVSAAVERLAGMLPAAVRPAAKVVWRAGILIRLAARGRRMPWPMRCSVMRAGPFLLPHYRPTVADVPVPAPGGPLYMARDSLVVDALTLAYLWEDRVFAVECAGNLVLDLGAHKGYFASWALAMGAAHVHSVEPSTANVIRLEKSRRVHARSSRWSAE